MQFIALPLNALLMIALPIALGIFLAERLRVGWRLFVAGAITFVASQAVHLPLNFGLTALFKAHVLPAPPAAWSLPFNAVVLGLTAGLCEEIARYVAYRWAIKSARTWREALMFGAGHGGIEAIIFGALAGLTALNLIYLKIAGLDVVPEAQRAAVAEQLAQVWSLPWYATLLGAVERVFALCFHVAMAVLVLQAITRKNLGWLAAAILLHAAVDGLAVFALQMWGAYWAEAVALVFALFGLGIIVVFKPRAEPSPSPRPSQPVQAAAPARIPVIDPVAELRRQLEDTRYTEV